MKQKRIFTTLVVVVVLLCLNIVYAAITSQTLTINGEVAASAGNEKVKVEFTESNVQAGSKGTVTATPDTDGDFTVATLNVSGLTTEGDTATVVYTIENKATDVAATLNTPAVNWDNTEWFDVKCTLSGVSLAKNDGVTSNDDTQTATVVVKLLKTPVTDADATAASDDITISIVADPVANAN